MHSIYIYIEETYLNREYISICTSYQVSVLDTSKSRICTKRCYLWWCVHSRNPDEKKYRNIQSATFRSIL